MTRDELLQRYAAGERDFRDANLSRADLSGADLSGADLSRAYLSGANLSGANLTDADLSGAHLSGADLTDARTSIRIDPIQNIDAAVLAIVEKQTGNWMARWHHTTECGTTHCRAGAAVLLSGAAGRVLEDRIGTSAAGALIYAASGSHPTPNWLATPEEALADLRERAAKAAQ